MKNPWKAPTALQLATRELEESIAQRLRMTSQREYYTGMERVIRERIARLKDDIKDLMNEEDPSSR